MNLGLLFASALILSACASSSQGKPEANLPTSGGAGSALKGVGPVSLSETERAQFPLSEKEKRKRIQSFKKDQNRALLEFKKEENKKLNQALSELKKQEAQWRDHEKRARQVFFEQNHSGPARREYVKTYIEKKKKFDQDAAANRAKARSYFQDQIKVFQLGQKAKLDEFKKSLDQNLKPMVSP